MTYEFRTKYFAIENEAGTVCESYSRAQAIKDAEELVTGDVVIRWMDEDGESLHDEDYFIEVTTSAAYPCLTKSELGLR